MLSKILFTIKASWRNRAILGGYIRDRSQQIAEVCTLNSEVLSSRGIKVLILDYDGVLAAHGCTAVDGPIAAWLAELNRDFVGMLYILSNNPTAARREYFRERYRRIQFVSGVRKKPYPDGILYIVGENPEVSPRDILLVDDRLFTGILAATLCGIQGLWVTKPLINLRGKFWAELWFMLLRWSEKVLVRVTAS